MSKEGDEMDGEMRGEQSRPDDNKQINEGNHKIKQEKMKEQRRKKEGR